MNTKKLLIILILTVFVTGICIGGVSAAKNSDGSADVTIKGEKYHLNSTEMKKADKGFTVEKKGKLTKQPTYEVKTVTRKVKKPVYAYKKVKVTKHKYYLTSAVNQKTFNKLCKKYHQVPGLKITYKNGGILTPDKVYYHFTYKGTKKVKYIKKYKTVKVKRKELVFTGYKTKQTHFQIGGGDTIVNYKGVNYVYSVKVYSNDYRNCLAWLYYDSTLTKKVDPFIAWGH